MTQMTPEDQPQQSEAPARLMYLREDALFIQTDYSSQSMPPMLYQYTDVAGLSGMVGSNSIWATNLDYLNDASEFAVGQNITLGAIDQALADCNDTGNDPLISVLQEVRSHIEKPEKSAYYVACFTKNGDQLSQWRGYGDNGSGYVVGFNTESLMHHVPNPDLNPENPPGVSDMRSSNVPLHEVIYVSADQDLKTSLPYQVLIKFIEKFESIRVLPGFDRAFLTEKSLLAHALSVRLQCDLARFKHTGFSEEDEFRFVYRHEPYFSQNQATTQRLQTRLRNGLLIPYVKITLGFEEEKNAEGVATGKQTIAAIRHIRTGPRLNAEKAKFGIESLYDSKWYGRTHLAIEPSDIPYLP